MTQNLRFLGVLPARAGSKGIPDKNLRNLAGQPLLHWAARALIESEVAERSICSTDSDRIANAAKKSGLEVPFLRPSQLATDTTPIVDVLLHAIRNLNESYSHIVLVQATTPTVTSLDIQKAVRLISEGADTVISGYLTHEHHPAIMYTLDAHQKVNWLLSGGNHAVRRQDFPPVFVRTGSVYIISVEHMIDSQSLYGQDIRAIEVDRSRAITIDEEADFLRAKQIMEES